MWTLPLLGELIVADAPVVAVQTQLFTPGVCAFEIAAKVGSYRCGTVNVPADTERGTGRIDNGVLSLEARETGNAAGLKGRIPDRGHGVAAMSKCARPLIASFVDDPK